MPRLALLLLAAVLVPAAALAVPLPHARPDALKKTAPVETIPQKPAEPKAGAPHATIPLPVPRPGNVEDAAIPETPEVDPICVALAASGEAEFELLPRIENGACGAPAPIRLHAIKPTGGQHVTIDDIVTRCAVAQAMVTWVRDDVQPAASRYYGEPITAFHQTGGYECRGRNRIVGAKVSEHGHANAADIGIFQLASGKKISVGNLDPVGSRFLRDVRNGACDPFMTVLGPGVAYHDAHLHLDMAVRGKNRRTTYCR